MLEQLSTRREEYRSIVRALRDPNGEKSYAEAVIASRGMDEDALVNVASVLFELSHDPDREPLENDVLWSQEFLDHLDTTGMEVRFKQRRIQIMGGETRADDPGMYWVRMSREDYDRLRDTNT